MCGLGGQARETDLWTRTTTVGRSVARFSPRGMGLSYPCPNLLLSVYPTVGPKLWLGLAKEGRGDCSSTASRQKVFRGPKRTRHLVRELVCPKGAHLLFKYCIEPLFIYLRGGIFFNESIWMNLPCLCSCYCIVHAKCIHTVYRTPPTRKFRSILPPIPILLSVARPPLPYLPPPDFLLQLLP